MATSDNKRTREQLEVILTPKERAFCWRYIVLRNGAKAAREAGYSENACAEIACQNLIKLHIKEYLEIIKDEIEEATGVSKFRQIEELAKIAYSGIEHLHNTWIELKDWDEIKQVNPNALAAIESIDTKTETKVIKTGNEEYQDVNVVYVKIKLHSKIAAITEINKMMGYNAPEKLEHSGEIKTTQPVFNFKNLNSEQ